MKRATLMGLMMSLIMGIVNIPGAVSAHGDRRYDRRDDKRYDRYDRRDDRSDNWWDRWTPPSRREVRREVEGTWYLHGNRDQRAEIVSSRDGLEARNERGQSTRLEFGRNGDVFARDWEGGLRGDVRGDTIEWENGTTWTRTRSGRAARR
ncbi:MAG: hypothetical protein WD688_14215 [Candidatus Binatia bacterium]